MRAGARLHPLEGARALIDPQSLLPAMNSDGTSIVRPANSWISALSWPRVARRYHCRPPWNPVRLYSALYTASSSSGSHVQAAIAVAEGIAGATVSAIPWSKSMM